MKVYNPYNHSIPLPVVDTTAATGFTHVNVMPRANIDLKDHVLHESAKQRWPKLHITEDKPVITAIAKPAAPTPTTAAAPAATAVEVVKDPKKTTSAAKE